MTKTDLLALLKPPPNQTKTNQNKYFIIPFIMQIKIFKVSKYYSCGICGNSYITLDEAWKCIGNCYVKQKHKIHIIELLQGCSEKFKCPFCFKIYANLSDAQLCFNNCERSIISALPLSALKIITETNIKNNKQNKVSKIITNYENTDETNTPVLLTNNEISNNKTILFNQPPPKEKEQNNENIIEKKLNISKTKTIKPESILSIPIVDVDNTQEKSISTNTNMSNNLEESTPNIPINNQEIKLKRKMNQKPFIRENAKYVCSVCKSKYFTQNEVKNCFTSHPLEEE